jgi:hypothetical protein
MQSPPATTEDACADVRRGPVIHPSRPRRTVAEEERTECPFCGRREAAVLGPTTVAKIEETRGFQLTSPLVAKRHRERVYEVRCMACQGPRGLHSTRGLQRFIAEDALHESLGEDSYRAAEAILSSGRRFITPQDVLVATARPERCDSCGEQKLTADRDGKRLCLVCIRSRGAR